jgi:DNA anti-recombination protein RmuC
MVAIELLQRKLTGLSGAFSPGDAREVARVLSDLCEHFSTVEDEISELRKRLHDAEEGIAELRDKMKK